MIAKWNGDVTAEQIASGAAGPPVEVDEGSRVGLGWLRPDGAYSLLVWNAGHRSHEDVLRAALGGAALIVHTDDGHDFEIPLRGSQGFAGSTWSSGSPRFRPNRDVQVVSMTLRAGGHDLFGATWDKPPRARRGRSYGLGIDFRIVVEPGYDGYPEPYTRAQLERDFPELRDHATRERIRSVVQIAAAELAAHGLADRRIASRPHFWRSFLLERNFTPPGPDAATVRRNRAGSLTDAVLPFA